MGFFTKNATAAQHLERLTAILAAAGCDAAELAAAEDINALDKEISARIDAAAQEAADEARVETVGAECAALLEAAGLDAEEDPRAKILELLEEAPAKRQRVSHLEDRLAACTEVLAEAGITIPEETGEDVDKTSAAEALRAALADRANRAAVDLAARQGVPADDAVATDPADSASSEKPASGQDFIDRIEEARRSGDLETAQTLFREYQEKFLKPGK